MKCKSLKLYCVLMFLFLIVGNVCSQTGPTIPCTECVQNDIRPIPYEGSWYNPEQSGSGFLFDVQNDGLLGYYFGYDETGDAVWATFSGQLQDPGESGGLWKLNATLNTAQGGSCFNCEYVAPVEGEGLGEIEIVFNRMAHASYSVDGGAVQNIVPLYFGYNAEPYFEEQTTFKIPELEGWWSVFLDFNIPVHAEQYSYSNYMVNFRKGSFLRGNELVFRATYYPNAPEALDAGAIQCMNDELSQELACIYAINLFTSGPYIFKINLGNISSDRVYGETENGDTIELLRTSSDYCIRTNQPENCINTGVFDYLD